MTAPPSATQPRSPARVLTATVTHTLTPSKRTCATPQPSPGSAQKRKGAPLDTSAGKKPMHAARFSPPAVTPVAMPTLCTAGVHQSLDPSPRTHRDASPHSNSPSAASMLPLAHVEPDGAAPPAEQRGDHGVRGGSGGAGNVTTGSNQTRLMGTGGGGVCELRDRRKDLADLNDKLQEVCVKPFRPCPSTCYLVSEGA